MGWSIWLRGLGLAGRLGVEHPISAVTPITIGGRISENIQYIDKASCSRNPSPCLRDGERSSNLCKCRVCDTIYIPLYIHVCVYRDIYNQGTNFFPPTS